MAHGNNKGRKAQSKASRPSHRPNKKVQRARDRRTREWRAGRYADGCPTPWKVAHERWEDAVERNVLHGQGGNGFGVYECACGYWHSTSSPGPLFRTFIPRRES